MVNERIIEDVVREHFKKQKINNTKLIIEEQKSQNPKIQKLLKGASKSGPGVGKPEFLISGIDRDLIIVGECKGNISKHQSKTGDEYTEYAVDGVKNYMIYLAEEFDVIGIAASGDDKFQVYSTFLLLKGTKDYKDLNQPNLVDIEWYLKKYKTDPDKEVIFIEEIERFARKLHNDFRDKLSLSEEEKPLLLSGILIALTAEEFVAGYQKAKDSQHVATLLYDRIKSVLNEADIKIDSNKISMMMTQYQFIIHHPSLIKDGSTYPIKDLIKDIKENVYDRYYRHNGYDILKGFYKEFLKYAMSDSKLGIVLTPSHITDLFVHIANIHYNDLVFDNCCGTASFLIDAMQKMIKEVEGNADEIKKIKSERLYGVELNPKMFTLACSNMFLKGDGSANIYQGSCFDLVKKEIKPNNPTKALINPPYSLKDPNLSELHFIKNALDGLSKNGNLVAIVPMSCAIKSSKMKEVLMKEHTLEAVMSMPNDLFYPVGVVPCIMVWKAHVPHDSTIETWFGYWKDDGFIKDKVRGRIDGGGWSKIRERWLDHLRNRRVVLGMSVKAKVGPTDEWCAEAYMETDYSIISEADFDSLVKDLVAWRIKND